MRDNKFNFDGKEYELRPLPIAEKKAKIRRKNMFEKNYITGELVLTCIAGAAGFAVMMYLLINWMA